MSNEPPAILCYSLCGYFICLREHLALPSTNHLGDSVATEAHTLPDEDVLPRGRIIAQVRVLVELEQVQHVCVLPQHTGGVVRVQLVAHEQRWGAARCVRVWVSKQIDEAV